MIKVGDRVRGWANKNSQPPMREGEVLDWFPHSEVTKIRLNDGSTRFVFKDTAELLSTPLPLPPPLDWSKPVRIAKYPDVKFRVLCTDAPGEVPVRIMNLGKFMSFVPGSVFHRGMDGTMPAVEWSFENVPPQPRREKRIVMMNKRGDMHMLAKWCGGEFMADIATARRVYPSSLAFCEVELVEGEGMLDSTNGGV